MDVDFLEDHRVNLKKSEKMDKCLGLARELKKLLNTRVAIVPIIARNDAKESRKKIKRTGNQGESLDH